MGKICSKVREDNLESASAASSPSLRMNAIPSTDMDKARKDVLYFWRHVAVAEPDNEFAGPEEQSPEMNGTASMRSLGALSGDTDTKVSSWAQHHVDRTRSIVNEVLGMRKSLSPDASQRLVAKLVNAVNADLVPAIEDEHAFSNSLLAVSKAFFEKFRSWAISKQKELTDGLPSSIVDALKQGLERSKLISLPQQTRAALEGNVQGVSGDVKSLVGGVAAALEAITIFMWRRGEIEIIRDFSDEAGSYHRVAEEGGKSSIHKDGPRFDAWLKAITTKTPVIPVITLKSGMVPDKMRFLQCYNGTNNTVSESDFFFAESYLDDVVKRTLEHAEQIGMNFTSSEPKVQSVLKDI